MTRRQVGSDTPSADPPAIEFAELVDRIGYRRADAPTPVRRLIGIVGPPGVGKSTIASSLSRQLTSRPPIVEMDGFHLPNSELRRLGNIERKGAPDTFDAGGFVELLRRLRNDVDDTVNAPRFDRAIDASVADATAAEPTDRMVLVEGNYLLLQSTPWDRVRPLLDLCVYLAIDDTLRRQRLVARHVESGKTHDAATRFVERSDDPNARTIAATRQRADFVLHV